MLYGENILPRTMSRSAWMCVLLVCEVTRRFSGILGQCSNDTRPMVVKTSPKDLNGIIGFQAITSVCEWKIMADEGYLIQVEVRKPNVPAEQNGPCNFTDLRFYEGESPDSPLLKGFCDFNGHLKVTSRGQVMLVQLPPAALADKDIDQRLTLFSHTAYPCGDLFVFFRSCKTPTLAGTTQRTRDTSTTTSKHLTTTTTTIINATNNNAEIKGFVIMGISTVILLGLVLFCCLKMKPFTRTWSRWLRKKERQRERERETENERDMERERQRRTRTLAAESAFVNEGVLSSDQDQTQTPRGSLPASTEDWQSGVESAEPPRRLQQELSPPPPPYSSLEFAVMDVHAQAQDEPPPPPLYTEAMKTAYPPV